MKKVVISIVVAAFAAVVTFNVGISSRGSSLLDVALANTEALANSECWTHGECCSSHGQWEWCGYCYGFYMSGC